MLLAVEGGGFFSSSASGYSKGLTLLFLGQKNSEEKPMRVTPWNQYQLVDTEADTDLQLASDKTQCVRGCASFVCFGGAAAGPDSPSPLKVGPAQQQEVVPHSLVSDDDDDDKSRDEIHPSAGAARNTKNSAKVTLKSSLKKPSRIITDFANDSDERSALCGEECEVAADEARRKVQWTDTSGGELFDVREFEPSEDDGSDDDLDRGSQKTCSCKIM